MRSPENVLQDLEFDRQQREAEIRLIDKCLWIILLDFEVFPDKTIINVNQFAGNSLSDLPFLDVINKVVTHEKTM